MPSDRKPDLRLDPALVGETLALVLGVTPEPAFIDELARVLDNREELLAWVVLRQRGLDGYPEVMAALREQAARRTTPQTRRDLSRPYALHARQIERDAEEALRQRIAEDLALSDLTDEIGALLHRLNEARPGDPGYAYRRHVVEVAPPPPPPAPPPAPAPPPPLPPEAEADGDPTPAG